MIRNVTVKFGPGREYEFKLQAADMLGGTPTTGRDWLDDMFVELECEPSNPMGKVLMADKVLNVAKYLGEKSFSEGSSQAWAFARNAALALERDTVRVDLPEFTLGY